MTAFWEGFASKLADQWGARLLSPALVFWTGGVLAWVSDDPRRFDHLGQSVQRLPAASQVGLVIAGLLVVVGSAVIVEQLAFSALRLMEGYRWGPLGTLLTRRKRVQLRHLDVRAQGLAAAGDAALPRIEAALRRHPAQGRELPTRLGNLLRASEDRPGERYGLDAATCWPHLWLVLDESTRSELVAARASLNGAAQLWLWSIAFAVWTLWAWWALPAAVVGAAYAYYVAALSAARTFGALVEAAFALHRHRLYRALRWPLPERPADEPAAGEALSLYLLRGISPDDLAFDRPE